MSTLNTKRPYFISRLLEIADSKLNEMISISIKYKYNIHGFKVILLLTYATLLLLSFVSVSDAFTIITIRERCLTCQSISLGMNSKYDQDSIETLTEKLEKLKNDLIGAGLGTEEGGDMSSEYFFRKTLLSTRLNDLKINNTRIDKSTILGAGRGLFANRNISEGEVITCYPGDALLCSEMHSNSDSDFDDEELDRRIIWGSHVPTKNRLDDDAVVYNDAADDFCSDSLLAHYALEVCDEFSIIGMPSLDSNPAYYGHFANDGAGHFANKAIGLGVNIEDEIAAYVNESIEISNAKHESIGGLHMVTIATQDINDGDEIFVTYGFDYWIENSF